VKLFSQAVLDALTAEEQLLLYSILDEPGNDLFIFYHSTSLHLLQSTIEAIRNLPKVTIHEIKKNYLAAIVPPEEVLG
jgi:hypothetical protein